MRRGCLDVSQTSGRTAAAEAGHDWRWRWFDLDGLFLEAHREGPVGARHGRRVRGDQRARRPKAPPRPAAEVVTGALAQFQRRGRLVGVFDRSGMPRRCRRGAREGHAAKVCQRERRTGVGRKAHRWRLDDPLGRGHVHARDAARGAEARARAQVADSQRHVVGPTQTSRRPRAARASVRPVRRESAHTRPSRPRSPNARSRRRCRSARARSSLRCRRRGPPMRPSGLLVPLCRWRLEPSMSPTRC